MAWVWEHTCVAGGWCCLSAIWILGPHSDPQHWWQAPLLTKPFYHLCTFFSSSVELVSYLPRGGYLYPVWLHLEHLWYFKVPGTQVFSKTFSQCLSGIEPCFSMGSGRSIPGALGKIWVESHCSKISRVACCLSQVSVAMMNTSNKNILGRKGFISPYNIQSITEGVKAGT